MFLFAWMNGVSKHLMQPENRDFSAVQVLWIRFLFLVLVTVALASRRGGIALLRTSRPGLQIIRSVFFVVQVGCFLIGFKYLQLAEVVSVSSAAPLLVTAMSVPLLGEHVGVRRWSAVSIGFVGVVVILRPGLAVVHPASLCMLLGTCLFAIFQIMTRVLARTDSSETTFAYTALIGAAAVSLIGPFQWTPPDANAWILLIIIAALGGLGSFVLIVALGSAPPAILQPLYYTIIVWSTFVGYLLFGDIPDAYTIIGACLIVSSGLYTVLRERRLAEKTTQGGRGAGAQSQRRRRRPNQRSESESGSRSGSESGSGSGTIQIPSLAPPLLLRASARLPQP